MGSAATSRRDKTCDVVLIAERDPVASAAPRRLEEVLAETEWSGIAGEVNRKRRAPNERGDDLGGQVGRAVIADLQLDRRKRLGR